MTAEEIQALAEAMAKAQMTHQQAPEVDNRPRERTRAAAQGLTFGLADEAEALARSQIGGQDYDAALADVRGKLKDYREARPGEALAYEAGGAVLPAVGAGILTGGVGAASQAPLLARLGRVVGTGMAEGGAYAFNAGGGGAMERVKEIPEGMAYGAAGAAAGSAVANAAGSGLRGLADFARRKFGPRAASVVEQQIQKAADDAGISVQEAVDGVVNGRLLADNQTIATIARGWRAQSGEADRVFREVYEERPGKLRKDMQDYLQSKMADTSDPNALRAQQASTEAGKAARSAEYNAAFDAMPETSEDVQKALADALVRVPNAGTNAGKIYRANTGESPFFKVTDEGEAVFARTPGLRDAEIVRRGVQDAVDAEYRSGAGSVASAYKDVEQELRGLLDEASQPLKDVRAKWSKIEDQSKAFDAGRKALSRSPDEVEIEFDKIRQKGEEEAAAYRSGLFSALRARGATGSGKSLPRNLASAERKEGQILRLVFPEDDLDEALGKIGLAADAQDASNTILGGSPTAITQGRIAEQAAGAAADGLAAMGGDVNSMLRLVTTAFKSARPQMAPKEAAAAARLVVESNPHVVAKALTDKGAMNQIYKLVDQFTRGTAKTATRAGGATGGMMSTDGAVSGLLSSF